MKRIVSLALVDSVALLQKPVGKGRLAVVDVRDDGEISDLGKVGHITLPLSSKIKLPYRVSPPCFRS